MLMHNLKIGDPLDEKNHVGPLIDKQAVEMYQKAIEACKKQGGHFMVEGGVLSGKGYESGCYVKPCIAEAKPEYRNCNAGNICSYSLPAQIQRPLMKLFKFKMRYLRVFLLLL